MNMHERVVTNSNGVAFEGLYIYTGLVLDN